MPFQGLWSQRVGGPGDLKTELCGKLQGVEFPPSPQAIELRYCQLALASLQPPVRVEYK